MLDYSLKKQKMKNLFVLTILISMITFSSCEEDSVTGCTDPTAINYDSSATENDSSCEYENTSNSDLIIGVWNVDSSSISMIMPQEMIGLLMMMSSMMSPEEFEEEMGFPMPSSQDEWDALSTNGISQDGEIIGTASITSSTFTMNDIDDVTELEYQLVNDTIIEFLNLEEDMDFEYFTINEVNETNLVLSSSFMEEDEEMSIEGIITIYLSK